MSTLDYEDSEVYIVLRSLENVLNNRHETFERKVESLVEVWKQVQDCRLTEHKQYIMHLMDWLKLHTLNIVLTGEWKKHKEIYEERLLQEVNHCEIILRHSNNIFSLRCKKLAEIIKDPWGSPVLNRLLTTPDLEIGAEEMDFFGMETGYLISTRLRKLCESHCEDLALNLVTAFMRFHEMAEQQNYTINATDDQKRFILDVYIALLYKYKKTRLIVSTLKSLSLSEGLELLKRFAHKRVNISKIWRQSGRIAALAANVYMTAAVMKLPAESAHILEGLLVTWLNMPETADNLPSVTNTVRRVMQAADSAIHMYTLCNAFYTKFGAQMRTFVIELYIMALTTDINVLQRQKEEKNTAAESESSERLSCGFLKLADVIDHNLRLCRESVLTAFSLNPSQEILDRIVALASDTGYDVVTPATLWKCDHPPSDASDEVSYKCPSCGDYKNHIELQSSLKSNTALSDAVQAETDLSSHLRDDLVVVLSSPRYHFLNWLGTWKNLYQLCVMYLADPDKMKNIITDLKFVDIDYSLFLGIKREPEDENANGIERGYEHYLEEAYPEAVETDTEIYPQDPPSAQIANENVESSSSPSSRSDPDVLKSLRLFRPNLKRPKHNYHEYMPPSKVFIQNQSEYNPFSYAQNISQPSTSNTFTQPSQRLTSEQLHARQMYELQALLLSTYARNTEKDGALNLSTKDRAPIDLSQHAEMYKSLKAAQKRLTTEPTPGTSKDTNAMYYRNRDASSSSSENSPMKRKTPQHNTVGGRSSSSQSSSSSTPQKHKRESPQKPETSYDSDPAFYEQVITHVRNDVSARLPKSDSTTSEEFQSIVDSCLDMQTAKENLRLAFEERRKLHLMHLLMSIPDSSNNQAVPNFQKMVCEALIGRFNNYSSNQISQSPLNRQNDSGTTSVASSPVAVCQEDFSYNVKSWKHDCLAYGRPFDSSLSHLEEASIEERMWTYKEFAKYQHHKRRNGSRSKGSQKKRDFSGDELISFMSTPSSHDRGRSRHKKKAALPKTSSVKSHSSANMGSDRSTVVLHNDPDIENFWMWYYENEGRYSPSRITTENEHFPTRPLIWAGETDLSSISSKEHTKSYPVNREDVSCPMPTNHANGVESETINSASTQQNYNLASDTHDVSLYSSSTSEWVPGSRSSEQSGITDSDKGLNETREPRVTRNVKRISYAVAESETSLESSRRSGSTISSTEQYSERSESKSASDLHDVSLYSSSGSEWLPESRSRTTDLDKGHNESREPRVTRNVNRISNVVAGAQTSLESSLQTGSQELNTEQSTSSEQSDSKSASNVHDGSNSTIISEWLPGDQSGTTASAMGHNESRDPRVTRNVNHISNVGAGSQTSLESSLQSGSQVLNTEQSSSRNSEHSDPKSASNMHDSSSSTTASEWFPGFQSSGQSGTRDSHMEHNESRDPRLTRNVNRMSNVVAESQTSLESSRKSASTMSSSEQSSSQNSESKSASNVHDSSSSTTVSEWLPGYQSGTTDWAKGHNESREPRVTRNVNRITNAVVESQSSLESSGSQESVESRTPNVREIRKTKKTCDSENETFTPQESEANTSRSEQNNVEWTRGSQHSVSNSIIILTDSDKCSTESEDSVQCKKRPIVRWTSTSEHRETKKTTTSGTVSSQKSQETKKAAKQKTDGNESRESDTTTDSDWLPNSQGVEENIISKYYLRNRKENASPHHNGNEGSSQDFWNNSAMNESPDSPEKDSQGDNNIPLPTRDNKSLSMNNSVITLSSFCEGQTHQNSLNSRESDNENQPSSREEQTSQQNSLNSRESDSESMPITISSSSHEEQTVTDSVPNWLRSDNECSSVNCSEDQIPPVSLRNSFEPRESYYSLLQKQKLSFEEERCASPSVPPKDYFDESYRISASEHNASTDSIRYLSSENGQEIIESDICFTSISSDRSDDSSSKDTSDSQLQRSDGQGILLLKTGKKRKVNKHGKNKRLSPNTDKSLLDVEVLSSPSVGSDRKRSKNDPKITNWGDILKNIPLITQNFDDNYRSFCDDDSNENGVGEDSSISDRSEFKMASNRKKKISKSPHLARTKAEHDWIRKYKLKEVRVMLHPLNWSDYKREGYNGPRTSKSKIRSGSKKTIKKSENMSTEKFRAKNTICANSDTKPWPLQDISPKVNCCSERKLNVETAEKSDVTAMNPCVVLKRLEFDKKRSASSVLAHVPGLNDLQLIRPSSVDRIVQVVQVPGARSIGNVPVPNAQTSTQVTPHIQRIGQPRTEKPLPSDSDSTTATTSSTTTNAASESPTLINILSQQIIRPANQNNCVKPRSSPLINILSQQIIKPAAAVSNSKVTSSSTTTDSQVNSIPRVISGGDQIINQLINQVRTPAPTLKTLVSSPGTEQNRILQFICKSSDGKLIPVTSFTSNKVVKVSMTQTGNASVSGTVGNEDNSGKVAQNTFKTKSDVPEGLDMLPKFQQAFGKPTYQNNVDSAESTGSNNETINSDTEKPVKNQPKNSPASLNVQPVQGGVIYTRQVPVGQTINLIPPGRGQVFRIATSNPEQLSLVKDSVIQGKMSALLAAALQGKQRPVENSETDANSEDDSQSSTRVTLTARTPLVQNARIIKPVLQIPSNVIRSAPPSNLSSTTLEQLREFDMVYKQVKERSSTSAPTESSPQSDSNDTPQQISVTYLNQSQKINCAPVVVVSSYCNVQPAASPALSVTSQGSSSPCVTPAPTLTLSSKASTKSPKAKPVKTTTTHTAKASPIPKPQQKPQEDEHTTQRIFDILAEYAEQLRNSPDLNNKPAPRRRSNPPTNPSQNTKRKKSSSSKKTGQSSNSLASDADIDDGHTVGSEDSSCGVVQISVQDDEQALAPVNTSESSEASASPKQLILTDSAPNQSHSLIIADSNVGEALKMSNTAVLVPGNYIMPVSMVKGGQQIAVVSGGSKILATVPARSGPNMLLFQSFLNQTRKHGLPTVKYSTIQPISGMSRNISAQATTTVSTTTSQNLTTVTLSPSVGIQKVSQMERADNFDTTEVYLAISQSQDVKLSEQSEHCITSTSKPNNDTMPSQGSYNEDRKEGPSASVATSVIAQATITKDEIVQSTTPRTMMALNLNTSDNEKDTALKVEGRVQSVLVTTGTSNGPMLSHNPPTYNKQVHSINSISESNKDEYLRTEGKVLRVLSHIDGQSLLFNQHKFSTVVAEDCI